MYKEIVILAKSIKKGGYCIAGIDTTTGEWIRPISENILNEGAVPLSDITYADNTQVEILDIVKIKLISHRPTVSQPENYIYDSNEIWEKTGITSLEDVIEFRGYDNPSKIFYNTYKSVTESEFIGQVSSLLLVNVEDSCINVKSFPERKLIQFNFKYKGEDYRYIKIGDERIKNLYENKTDGYYNEREELPVVFSLTDKYNRDNKHYKMAAQLFY